VALILEVMSGYDPADPTSANRPVPAFRESLRTRLVDVRVGVPTEFFFDLLHPEVERGVRNAIGVLEQLGATIVPITIPDLEDALTARMPLSAEGLALHDPYLREHGELFSDELRHRLLAAYFIPGRDLARANRVRRLVKERFQAAFQSVDLLATPACTTPALALTDQSVMLTDFRTGEVVETAIFPAMIRMTALFNATGLPAISTPAGFTEAGLPIGLQLVGRPFEDHLVLGAAHAYEQATAWHTVKPPYVTRAVPA
jgi:aspartyl-tRNA(Asn)/glutamyl-tRNA(Gln) amidotransferase subunit A